MFLKPEPKINDYNVRAPCSGLVDNILKPVLQPTDSRISNVIINLIYK